MAYQHIEVKPIAGALGAEIGGVDLSLTLDDNVFDEVREALRENKNLTDDVVAFAARVADLLEADNQISLPPEYYLDHQVASTLNVYEQLLGNSAH